MISVVVLAILAAYATPKLFGVKEQADATEETLKIKDIEARHSQEILKAGKRGGHPILGDVVGFRPEVTAEPAPDTAPVLVDYGWRLDPLQGVIVTQNTTPSTTSPIALTEPPADQRVPCSGPAIYEMLSPRLRGEEGNITWFYNDFVLEVRASLTRGSAETGLLVSDPVPVCDFVFDVVQRGSSANFYGLPLATRDNILNNAVWDWWPSEPGIIWHYPSAVRAVGGRAYLGGGWSSATQINPFYWRPTCAPHSSRYGAPYLLSGLAGQSSNSVGTTLGGAGSSISLSTQNGVETAKWWGHPERNNPNNAPSPPNPGASAVCARQGPAPAVPPSDPGDPGAYPMASDHSGYCLSPGRKLPTYRDSNGTPTSSASDPVMELETEAVDDPANCP